jgi:hypothetical protein
VKGRAAPRDRCVRAGRAWRIAAPEWPAIASKLRARARSEQIMILSARLPARYLQRMQYRGAEDRLNPIAPEGVDDSTLGGYPAVHGRAPAFEGADGQPYTVAIETEHDAGSGWAAYLVFVRWAASGTAIMGHLETGDLSHASTEAAARAALEAWPLERAKKLLDEIIARRPLTSDS